MSVFNSKFVKVLEKLFGVPAPIIFVTGRMGRGKTDFCLLIGELALQYGWVKHVATNIKVFDERFLHITSWAELENWLKLDKRKKLYIFDEASSNISRRTPMAQLNRKIIDLAFKLRKYRAHLLLAAVSRGLVDSTFEAIPDLVLGEFQKISRETAILQSDLFDDLIVIRNIPPTTVKFDTYDIAPFSLTPPDEGLQFLCCKVAKRYYELKNYSKVAQEFGIHRQQVKDLVLKHLQHTFGQVKMSEEEHIKIQNSDKEKENDVGFTLQSNVKWRK